MTAPTPIFQLEGADGIPLIYAQMAFTLTGTTTAATVYSDSSLSTAYPSTSDGCIVTAEDDGKFPAIFLDPDVTYRMRLITAGGDFANPLLDRDPVNQLLSISASDIADGAIETKLGYTPMNPASPMATGEMRLTYSAALGVMHQDSVGFRINPYVIKDASYTFVLDDAQKLYIKDDTSTPTWTIPPNSDVPFPVGAYIELTNVNTNAVTIARGTGVSLVIAGTGTDANVSLAQWGVARLQQYAVDYWIISGTGLS